MPIDPEQVWIDAFAALAPQKGPMWAQPMADAVDARVTGKVALNGLTGSVTFTFNKAVFMAQLMALTPTPDAAAGMMGFANAWGAAMLASTLVVAPGSFFPAPAPATLWSVVFATVIDGASIETAKQALVAELMAVAPAKDAKESKFPPAFRNAFLKCTASVNGLNSLPPPTAGPGPLPFSAPFVPLL
jgi:hypothetical protein